MTKWTEEEIKIIKEQYGKVKTNEISKMINRNIYAIRGKANRLGITIRQKKSLPQAPIVMNRTEKIKAIKFYRVLTDLKRYAFKTGAKASINLPDLKKAFALIYF